MKKGIIKLLIAIAVLSVGINVYAASGKNGIMDDYMVSKSKKATELDDNLQTTVTLSLPSVDESKCLDCVDIVFVMDKSSSPSNAGLNFSQQVTNLVARLKERNLKVKIGIVKFRGTASDAISDTTDGAYSKLVRYDDNMDNYIEAAINSTPNGSGSNIHAGLQLANKWLKEDTEVSDSQKNVVLLTDGKSYIWNDDEGNAITNYAQYPTKNVVQNGGLPSANQNQLKDKYDWYSAFYKKLGNLVWFTNSDLSGSAISVDFNSLYNSTNEELKNTTKYDTKIDWDTWNGGKLSGTVEKIKVTDNPNGYISEFYEFTPDSSVDSNIVWLESNPYEYVVNDDGTISYTDVPNEDYLYYHPSNLEKGIYKAAHLYNEMNKKYVMSVIYPAKNPASGALSLLADQFNQWLANVSENSSTLDGDYTKIFDNIENDSVYLITKGKVTDVIGNDFDLVINNNPFTLTIEDEALTSTKISDNEWGFGDIDQNGEYPYKVTYNPDKEEFYWDISVPVDVIKHVKLSYTLELKNVPTEAGEYVFDTNEEAYLEYTSVYGDNNPKEYFEKPKLNYIIGKVTAEYVDEDGKTLADDEEIKGRVGKEYKTEEKSFDDYDLSSVDGNPTGTFTKEDILVTYNYKAKTGTVIAHYVDVDGNNIADDNVYTGKVGETYSTEQLEFGEYYLEDIEGSTDGKFINGTIEVTYIYDLSGTGDFEPEEEEITPPQTGYEINSYYVLSMSLVSGFATFKLLSKKED